jgi:hypothetical protein
LSGEELVNIAKENNKRFYHAIRILKEAERIATGRGPSVWIADEQEKQLYLLIF